MYGRHGFSPSRTGSNLLSKLAVILLSIALPSPQLNLFTISQEITNSDLKMIHYNHRFTSFPHSFLCVSSSLALILSPFLCLPCLVSLSLSQKPKSQKKNHIPKTLLFFLNPKRFPFYTKDKKENPF